MRFLSVFVARSFAENLQGLRQVEEGIRQVAASVATQYFSNSREFDLHSLQLMPGQGPFGPNPTVHPDAEVDG